MYTDDSAAFGRVSLGILDPETQPIWNEDKTLCIVMEGEIYDYDGEKQRLIERGYRFQVNNDPEFLLHMYEAYGEDAALRLNGAFVAAIWDVKRERLLILNDRYGLVPLFYAHSKGQLLFSGGARAVAAHPDFVPRADAIAVAEFLTLEQVVGDRTLFDGITLLPPASLLTFGDKQLKIRSYWDFQFHEDYRDRDESWYIERWIHLMHQAVERRTRTGRPFGVLLSGGLDSRTVLAMMDRACYPVHAFTFGIPGCDDARLAREVALKSGATPSFMALKPDFLIEMAEEGVRLTDGLNSCRHMHALAPLREVAQQVQVVFTGSVGDSLMGDHARTAYCQQSVAPDNGVLESALFKGRNRCFPETEHARLFNDAFYQQIKGTVFESFKGVLAQSKAVLATNKRKYWAIRQSNRRYVLEGQRLLRSQVIVRMPFYDNDFFDFMLAVPSGLRLGGSLYAQAFSTASPELAKIPWTKTGLPLTACMRDVRIRFDRQLRWWLRAKGLKWISESPKKHYVDYDGWMRTALRPWVEETLLSKRSLERGYFDPEYVRNLVAEHMAGANRARRLAVLLTLELWHRLFLD
jgi:asparagine synthase (glutamine-hydrolysing)